MCRASATSTASSVRRSVCTQPRRFCCRTSRLRTARLAATTCPATRCCS
uniref:Uncharacterized protein n=1 Tax=Arundo donax TaxID=35708 RepID=A0A0A8ZTN8_ARUDO